jgi:hypothetical protein
MSEREHIIVVSGSVRSGTSLMMQLLEAGGVSLYYDNNKPPDESNPYGYFEKTEMFMFAAQGGAESPFLTLLKGKGVKILPPSIVPEVVRNTKDLLIKVIFMIRDETEVANSYITMIENLDKMNKSISPFYGLTREEAIEKFKEIRRANIQSALDFFDSEENTAQVLIVNHNDLILNSLETLTQISNFIRADLPQYEMNPETMVEIVDINLYRQRQSIGE